MLMSQNRSCLSDRLDVAVREKSRVVHFRQVLGKWVHSRGEGVWEVCVLSAPGHELCISSVRRW